MTLYHLRLSSELFRELAGCPSLKNVNLAGSQFTDDDFQLLSALKTIERLYVNDTKVTHQGGLPVLKQNPIKRFSFDQRNSMGREAMEVLSTSKSLTFLSGANTSLTDDDVVLLARCPTIRILRLPGNVLSTPAVAALSQLSDLRYLDVENCGIKDEDIRPIANAKSVTEMRLGGNELTDGSIETFGNMPQLQFLNIADNRLTHEGIEMLRARLPHCQVGDSARGMIIVPRD